jgi:hypothetical protein
MLTNHECLCKEPRKVQAYCVRSPGVHELHYALLSASSNVHTARRVRLSRMHLYWSCDCSWALRA